MGLEDLHEYLGWPTRDQVLNPSKNAARVRADFARTRLGTALRQLLQATTPNISVAVSLLEPGADASTSGTPSAIICEFSRTAPDEVHAAAHRLSWNFCRSPLLLTVEPSLVRAWTCCERPALLGEDHLRAELRDLRLP